MNFDAAPIIQQLAANRAVFQALLSDLKKTRYSWKPAPDQWCLLEVICHLLDEEKEDFRARVKHTLLHPEKEMPRIDPASWVESQAYLQQNYKEKLAHFLKEREVSIAWLRSLQSPNWSNFYEHKLLGPLSAATFLSNWLAHDYLHIRQINRIKFQYHAAACGQDLTYAGDF